MAHNTGSEALTSISTVPNKVLSIIFEAVCLSSPPESKRSSFEIFLSHVTGRWRSVALNIPQLWAEIHIDSRFSCHFQMTEAYLLRSRALSLDIHIIIGGPASQKLNVACVCQMLTAHIHRWSRLRLHCVWQVYLDRLLSLMRSHTAPYLRRIDMSLESDPNTDMVSRCIFSGGAPSLTHIRLRNVALQTCLPPLKSVTHLRLDEPKRRIRTSPTQLASMLRGLTALTHLVLSGDYGTPATPIEMPSLRSLHTLIFTDSFPTMLNMISAPQLECLLLEEICPEDIDGFANLVDLASASPKFPSLQSLTILSRHNQGFAPSTWINAMRAFPTITCMTLSCNDPYDFLLTLCAEMGPSASHSSTIPWQNLHTLTLIAQLWQAPYAALVLCNTVTARITTGYPIQKLQLSGGILSGLVDKLEWLQAQVVVERTILFQNMPRHTFFADLLDWV